MGTHMQSSEWYRRGVSGCVHIPHDNLKTIADIWFLLGSYIDRRNISDKFACQDVGDQAQGHFSESSSSVGKVMSYFSVAGSEIQSPMALYSSYVIGLPWDPLARGDIPLPQPAAPVRPSAVGPFAGLWLWFCDKKFALVLRRQIHCCWYYCCIMFFNPLIATLKPQSNGPSYWSDWYTGRW